MITKFMFFFRDSEPITSEDLLEINNIKNQTESNSFFGYDFIDTGKIINFQENDT